MPPNLLKRRTNELLGGADSVAAAVRPEDSSGSNRLFGLSPDFPKVVELRLTQIERNPDQPRKLFDPDEIAGLAASIDRVGQQNPILVKRLERDRYLLVGGERRIRACETLGRSTIYAIVTTGDPDEIALIDNVQRVDLNALELAEALARLIERHQYTQEQVGAIIGRSQTEVAKLLSLRRLPASIREAYWAAPDQVSRLMPRMLLDLQNRGQLAAGMATYNPDRDKLVDTYKDTGTVIEAFRINEPSKYASIMEDYAGCAAIGHTRYATCGSQSRSYAQPFEYRHGRKWKWFAFAVIACGLALRALLRKPKLEGTGNP